MRLLIIEDSVRLQESLQAGLTRSGFAVDVVGDGRRGLVFAQRGLYDVVILDLMLPDLDGLEVLRELRAKNSDVHVIILTARHAVEDRVRGLQLGADDYVPKPFAFEELLARIQALVRRRYGGKTSVVSVGDVQIDTAGRSVTCAGHPVRLARREYRILEYLCRRRGSTVSRIEIEDHVYGERNLPGSNSVESAISTIRKKLSAAAGRPVELIETRHGFGYSVPGD
jgi:DNA-binding response OmpR family regulator